MRRQLVAPPDQEASKLQTSIAPRLHQVAAAFGRVLALAGADGDPADGADVAHVAGVVGPEAGLFEPADVEFVDAAAEVERLGAGVALVCVDGDDEVVAGCFAGGGDAFGVLAGGLAADLEFAAVEAAFAPFGDLVADPGEVAAVVAADDVDRDRVAVAAPELPQRPAERFPDRVPERDVDRGERDQPDPLVAELVVGGGEPELPAALDREGVLADQPAARSPRRSPPRSAAASSPRPRRRPPRRSPRA